MKKIVSSFMIGLLLISNYVLPVMAEGDIAADASYPLKQYLIISLIVALIIAFVGTAILKGQLKSVAPKNEASDYIKSGSMHVKVEKDMYLYKKVEKEKKPETNNSNSK